MSVERRGPAVCNFSGNQGGKDEMTKASNDLQDLRRRIYVKAKAETTWRFWDIVRVLSIPAIRDRVVQGALKLILEPIFEADFQPGSFGYRPKRTAHEAVDRVARQLFSRKHVS